MTPKRAFLICEVIALRRRDAGGGKVADQIASMIADVAKAWRKVIATKPENDHHQIRPRLPETRSCWCENPSIQDNNLPAPQPKCHCRACYRAREDTLPIELLRWLHQPHDHTKYSISPSRSIVKRHLSMFCADALDDPWTAIIIALSEYNDKLVEQACQATTLKPLTMEAEKK